MRLFDNNDFNGVMKEETSPKYNGDKPTHPIRDFIFQKKAAQVLYDHNNNKADAAAEPHDEKNFNLDYVPKYGTDLSFKRKIVWTNAIGFLVLHLAGVYGFYLGFTEAKLLTVIWMAVVVAFASEGVTLGAHRHWTHRSFKARLPLSITLLIGFTMAGQNCLWVWVRDHRQHHRYSDTDADPHNANRGFFFSHIGWLMSRKHPLVKEAGKTIDMSDLEADPLIMLQKKYYKTLYVIFSLVLPTIVPVILWNETLWTSLMVTFVARTVAILNLTWSVNSVAHFYGYKAYDKNIRPVESTFVSFIGLGEGWHNYHHSFPWDYKAAELGIPFNFSSSIIRWFRRQGWAYDLKEASQDMVYSRATRTGDGTHFINSLMKNAAK